MHAMQSTTSKDSDEEHYLLQLAQAIFLMGSETAATTQCPAPGSLYVEAQKLDWSRIALQGLERSLGLLVV